MDAAPNPCIHPEAMEETENQIEESHQAGCAGILRTDGGQQTKGLLVYGRNRSGKRAVTNERLTRAGLFELSPAYESVRSARIGRTVYRTVRTVQ